MPHQGVVRSFSIRVSAVTLVIVAGLCAGAIAKEKPRAVDVNDASGRLFQFLDSERGGRLTEFYLLCDVYKNPKESGDELQRVIRVEYDKSRVFGKLSIHVRSVQKLQPDQLKVYTPKMVYEFGVADSEKFVKTEPGPLGRAGDLYLRSTDDRPLSTAEITDDVQQEFDRLIATCLLPALQKK